MHYRRLDTMVRLQVVPPLLTAGELAGAFANGVGDALAPSAGRPEIRAGQQGSR